jgi:hypothetical protein
MNDPYAMKLYKMTFSTDHHVHVGARSVDDVTHAYTQHRGPDALIDCTVKSIELVDEELILPSWEMKNQGE